MVNTINLTSTVDVDLDHLTEVLAGFSNVNFCFVLICSWFFPTILEENHYVSHYLLTAFYYKSCTFSSIISINLCNRPMKPFKTPYLGYWKSEI